MLSSNPNENSELDKNSYEYRMNNAQGKANRETRKQIALTLRVLQEIKDSLTMFKPSKSLSMLTELAEDYKETSAAEIDLVCSGGGMKGYFMTGCYDVLESELSKRNIRIRRVAGASAGAWAGLFICTGLGTAAWIETYYAFKEHEGKSGATVHEAYDSMYVEWIRRMLPEDAYKRCCGRLFISISIVTLFGLKNRIISEYTSNDDLFEACCASSTIPFITERHGLRRFRGELVADGSLTNDLPIFADHSRRQLVIKLYELDYSYRLVASAQDECIEVLVIRGALLMSQFLEGVKSTNCIAWLDRNEGTKYDLPGDVHDGIYRYVSSTLRDNKYMLLTLGVTIGYLVHSKRIDVKRTVMILQNSLNNFVLNNTFIATTCKLVYGFTLFTTGGIYDALVSLYT